jgi:hypothetical protein
VTHLPSYRRSARAAAGINDPELTRWFAHQLDGGFTVPLEWGALRVPQPMAHPNNARRNDKPGIVGGLCIVYCTAEDPVQW